jgi:hypothetical protein
MYQELFFTHAILFNFPQRFGKVSNLLFYFFEIRSCYVAQTGFELQIFLLSLQSAVISGAHYHAGILL